MPGGARRSAAGIASRPGCHDRSGLLHAILRRYGVRIPRDARDMAGVSAGLSAAEARPGDLVPLTRPDTGVFHHVALALDLLRALDVSEPDRACADTRLSEAREVS